DLVFRNQSSQTLLRHDFNLYEDICKQFRTTANKKWPPRFPNRAHLTPAWQHLLARVERWLQSKQTRITCFRSLLFCRYTAFCEKAPAIQFPSQRRVDVASTIAR